ncbi:MAG: RNA polymerase sigma factor [Clostridia bacterium]|nr:RNA polymerase sigma factor [Clostridia bacterium]
MTKYSLMDDETLVEMCLLGKSDAFEELVLRHEKAVMNTARKVTCNRYSAEDASQDAFVSAWTRLDTLRDRSKFKPWICAIAKNCATALVARYHNAIPDISLDLVENEELQGNPDPELSELITSETEEELHAMVDALSEKLRETIRLHYFGGYSVDEIAKRLSVPVGTVKWRLAEGRKQLRKGYGIMDKTYDENERLVSRVMRQVEELKLWGLKNDKSGFEKDYENVLTAVESLDESKEKQRMLADVWLRKAWWIEDSEELRAKIKEAAIAGHNEDVMQAVACYEYKKYDGKEKIAFMRNTQIPELEKYGFVKALAYVWFWMGHQYGSIGDNDKMFEAYDKVISLLEPTDVYYANALSAIKTEKRLAEAKEEGVTGAGIGCTGETFRKIDGKWFFWDQPGYSRESNYLWDIEIAPFYWLSQCDSVIYDPTLESGGSITSENGKVTLSCRNAEKPVETPAGTFDNCLIFNTNGRTWCEFDVETTVAPGVGIVKQTLAKNNIICRFTLTSYELKGGEGYFPFAPGNRWTYHAESTVYSVEDEQTVEIAGVSDDKVTASRSTFAVITPNENSWAGNMLAARNNYYRKENSREILSDVEPYLQKAEKLAVTRREKVHTAVAAKTMRRIFATDEIYNPNFTEYGRWNFFELLDVRSENGKILLEEDDGPFSFEWKEWFWKDGKSCFDQFAVGCNFLYDITDFALGALWSDKWIPGYTEERKFKQYDQDVSGKIEVCNDEDVSTPAGTYSACRHIVADIKGGISYWSGHTEFWYAQGVGLVKFLRTVTECGEPKNAVWMLTAHEGDGEGYFPMKDGFFRRYEAQGLENGFHGAVEYTCVEDMQGMTLFKDALGTQDKEFYLKMK